MKKAGEQNKKLLSTATWEHTSQTDVTPKLCFTNGCPCRYAQAFHLPLSLRCCFCHSPWFCCPVWSPSQIPRSASMETSAHWEVSFLAEISPPSSPCGEKPITTTLYCPVAANLRGKFHAWRVRGSWICVMYHLVDKPLGLGWSLVTAIGRTEGGDTD